MWLEKAKRSGRKFLNPVPTRVGGLKTVLKTLPQFLTNREERVPKEPLGPFQTHPEVYATTPPSGLRVTWFGHSSLLVEIDGQRVLIDPVWDRRASPIQWLGPKRFFPPTLSIEELPALDAILLSHDHYDHLGAGTVREIARLLPEVRWIAPLGLRPILRKLHARNITELDWTETTTVGHLTVTALPARHFSGRSVTSRFETLWASYALRTPGHNVFYGADSGWWKGFGEIARTHGPFDLTMLEIGAFNELWADIHLGPDGAARAFAAMGGTGLLMPIHWGLFDLALHGWREPIERISALNLPLWSPEPGLPTEVLPGSQLRSGWWQKSQDAR